MSDTVIKVENLGKKYIISHLADKREQLFSGLLVNKAKSLLGRGKKALSAPFTSHDSQFTDTQEDFWALKDVSFEIKQGDRVGIIGRNGAGKSTLLKILSRITEPTKGRITIDGRVASLLEVGTGFHSELSGRENIYLNGAILGMSREEIKRKFDEIVAFSEVEKFLDTPVKRYSSGMYVRLAFAVAAHLEPEILIVDEVLAVGDAQFQRKCLGKMEDVSTKEGRTVLFVSHNMGTVRNLCNLGILLDKGQVVCSGSSSEVISAYDKTCVGVNEGTWINDEIVTNGVRIDKIKVVDSNGECRAQFFNSETIIIQIHVKAIETTANVKVGFDLIRESVIAFRTEQVDSMGKKDFAIDEEVVLSCEVPAWFLNAGEYFLRPLISVHCVKSLTKQDAPVLSFKVLINPEKSEFHTVLNENNHPGAVFPIFYWEISNDFMGLGGSK